MDQQTINYSSKRVHLKEKRKTDKGCKHCAYSKTNGTLLGHYLEKETSRNWSKGTDTNARV